MTDPIPSTEQAGHIPGSTPPAPAAAPAPTSTAAPASTPAAPAPAAAPPATTPSSAPAPAQPTSVPPSSPSTLLGSALEGSIAWKLPPSLGDLDPTVKAALDGWATANKFTAEQANKIFDLIPAWVEFEERRGAAAMKATRDAWKESVQKEHGTAFEQAKADAIAYVRRNGDKELVEFFEDYGAGDNPAIMRLLVKGQREHAADQAEIAKLQAFIRERMSEDTSALEGSRSGNSGPHRTPQQILYDHPSSQPPRR